MYCSRTNLTRCMTLKLLVQVRLTFYVWILLSGDARVGYYSCVLCAD